MTDFTVEQDLPWVRSTRCGANSDCVEVAIGPAAVLVRDTKDQSGRILAVTPAAWRGFVAMIRAGTHDYGSA